MNWIRRVFFFWLDLKTSTKWWGRSFWPPNICVIGLSFGSNIWAALLAAKATNVGFFCQCSKGSVLSPRTMSWNVVFLCSNHQKWILGWFVSDFHVSYLSTFVSRAGVAPAECLPLLQERDETARDTQGPCFPRDILTNKSGDERNKNGKSRG